MANDYISRDYAVENMENFPWDTEHDKNAAIHLVRELVPAAKVQPVVNGEWEEIAIIPDAYDIAGVITWASKMRCQKCGFTTYAIEGGFSQYNFCPNCGADMRPEKQKEGGGEDG